MSGQPGLGACHLGPQSVQLPQQQARFKPLKHLGKGAQGFVQLAQDTLTNEQVAIKYIDRGWSRGFYKYVLREIQNHQQLSLCGHPHIVQFLEVVLTPSYLGVVMEYVPGTNLQQYLEAAGGKLPEDVARFIFQQLIIAVDFCHRMGKVNRDIKLANILLQLEQLPLVKLCDFGFSKDKLNDSAPQTQIGTALFTAPEIFTNVQGQAYDAEAADLWSCGIVLFVMLFGQHPFLASEDPDMKRHAQVMMLIENSVQGQIQLPAGAEEMYPAALNLIQGILISTPSARVKMSGIMQHPWFTAKLPPGATLLNEAYLSMGQANGALRQTPEEVHALVKAAVSVPRASLEHTFSSAGSAENGRSGSVGVSHPAQQAGALGLMGVAQSTAAGPVTMGGVSLQHGPLTPRHPQGNNAGTSQHPITQYGTPSGSPAAMAGPGPGPGSMHEQCQQGCVGQLDSSSLGLSDDLLNASMFLGGPGGPVGALSGPMGQPFPVMQPQSIGDLADLNIGRSQHSDGQNVLLDSSILFDLTSGMH